MKKRIAQDDIRERTVCKMLGLLRSEESPFSHLTKKREGIDAFDDHGNPFEIKGTSEDRNDGCFSTARDVTVNKVNKWRKQYWIFAIGDNYEARYDCKELYIFHPSQLEFFFLDVQRRIEYLQEKTQKLVEYAKTGPFSSSEISFFEKKLGKSTTVNDPRIRLCWVRDLGYSLYTHSKPHNVQKRFSQFITEHPLLVDCKPNRKEVDLFAVI